MKIYTESAPKASLRLLILCLFLAVLCILPQTGYAQKINKHELPVNMLIVDCKTVNDGNVDQGIQFKTIPRGASYDMLYKIAMAGQNKKPVGFAMFLQTRDGNYVYVVSPKGTNEAAITLNKSHSKELVFGPVYSDDTKKLQDDSISEQIRKDMWKYC